MPFNRHLFHRSAEHPGEEQNFDVKDPGRQVLTGEDLLRSFPGEELESALGITDMANTEHTENCVKTIHQEISKKRALRQH